MEPLSCLQLQLNLEGKEVIRRRLRQVAQVPGEELPLLLLAQFPGQECVVYYAGTLTADLHEELAQQDFEFPEVHSLLRVLTSNHIEFEIGHYKTYVCLSPQAPNPEVLCLSKDVPTVKAFGFDGFAEQVYAVERDGALVSACVSTRENESCGEAWVFTQPEYRKHGFAQKVVHAWAASLRKAGKVPFYSHDLQNEASARLAGKLGLLPVFEEITITQTNTPR